MLGMSAARLGLLHLEALSVCHDSYDLALARNEVVLKELDTFLAFSAKDLGFASLYEDIERLHHGIRVHTMELYKIVSKTPQYKRRAIYIYPAK